MSTAWPALREELDLLPGPVLPDGQPSWTLHDPVRNLFFQLDWASFEVLKRWHLGAAEAITRNIMAQTTLTLHKEDVNTFFQFAQRNDLLEPPSNSADALAERWQSRRSSWLQWLLHNYLFFRVPLIKPDPWLTRWAPALEFLFSRTFGWISLLALFAGLWGVSRSWGTFTATLVDSLSWPGMLAYGLMLGFVKLLHELGHGLMAKRFGCRVPTMGIAFLVLWPVAYTDTNEVWKLTQRDQRLKVAGAGIATELIIAAWALLAWVWLPEGAPKSMAFLLATTTWVSTLAINASPFMRFDGYFLLSDFLQMPNLHSRAFALARWDMREKLFKLGEPPPESFSNTKRRGLILFAWATWIYRLVLFLGIAALVYHFFIKALGILLFLVEIVWFVAKPLWSEISAWYSRWPQIVRSRRAQWSAIGSLVLIALCWLPLPAPVRTEGMLQSSEIWPLHALDASQLQQQMFGDARTVEVEAPVFMLYSPALKAAQAQNDAQRTQYSQQIAAAGFDSELRRDWQVLQERQLQAATQQQAVETEASRYRLNASGAGVLRDVDPDLRSGDWLARNELLGRVVGSDRLEVLAYVQEEDVQRISIGDSAIFIADAGVGPVLDLTVRSVDQDASRTLSEAALSAAAGGMIQVRSMQGTLYPERPVYRVVLNVVTPLETDAVLQHRWRGKVSIRGQWEAAAAQFVKTATSVFWREAGF
ncbi:site-2 protease family protein [Comamonas sp. 26]|uniref:site-2 protease family protein n=1 Tax=Comamonas sp. 26 TaxID=2035201 RepID=UPI000C651973|nr:site-2 protease family protein [Comamonas sp. 26]PIG07921.1 putative peptide zinc metalloprotease protein [Comamonas sp. 26]